MRTAPFDTYPYIKNLETKGGFNEAQAESILEAINGAQTALFSGVATKNDIAQLTNTISQLATKAELADLRNELTKMGTNISDAKSELKGWMFTGFIAIAGLMATLHFIH